VHPLDQIRPRDVEDLRTALQAGVVLRLGKLLKRSAHRTVKHDHPTLKLFQK